MGSWEGRVSYVPLTCATHAHTEMDTLMQYIWCNNLIPIRSAIILTSPYFLCVALSIYMLFSFNVLLEFLNFHQDEVEVEANSSYSWRTSRGSTGSFVEWTGTEDDGVKTFLCLPGQRTCILYLLYIKSWEGKTSASAALGINEGHKL